MDQPPPNPYEQPPQYVAYPRGQLYEDASKLQALADGYFGLNRVFLINIVVALASRGVSATITPDTAVGAFVVISLFVGIVIGFLTYPHNKKIGYGANWSPSGPAVASTLMGINSALCCGIIGYVVVQQIAASEMKKYGLRTGFFGLKKRDIEARVAQLQQAQAGGIPPYADPMP